MEANTARLVTLLLTTTPDDLLPTDHTHPPYQPDCGARSPRRLADLRPYKREGASTIDFPAIACPARRS
jgi:hypothetical protein